MSNPDDYDDEGEERRRNHRLVAGGAAALLGVLVGLYALMNYLEGRLPAAPDAVQWVSVVPPPPPPPPEELPLVEEEEPLEHPELEELVQQEEAPPPDLDAEPPAPGLGLDAEGGAGADGFGLVGRKGGRPLVGGASGGTGNVAGWYTGVLQRDILAHLERHEKLRKKKFSIVVRLWLASDGRVQRSELTSSTGDEGMDALLETALNDGLTISAAPPEPKFSRVKIRVSTRM